MNLLLPLRDRLLPCLFVMLQAAYQALWGTGRSVPWVPSEYLGCLALVLAALPLLVHLMKE